MEKILFAIFDKIACVYGHAELDLAQFCNNFKNS